MSNLRDKVIKLAYSNPKLREHLIPILKEAGKDSSYYTEKRKSLRPGHTMIVDLPTSTKFLNFEGEVFKILGQREGRGGLVTVETKNLDSGYMESFDGEYIVEKSDILRK